MRNAIPREAYATVAVAADKADALKALVNTLPCAAENELEAKEKNPVVLVEAVDNDKAALTQASRDTFIRLLNATPNGVIRNSDVAKGVVETSLNVGVVTMTDDNVQIHCLIRSLIDSGKDYVVSMLDSLGKLAGRKPKPKALTPLATGRQFAGDAPGTRDLPASVQQDAEHPDHSRRSGMRSVQKPYPEMDMVSIGPTITGPHSPDEQVHIESVGQYWTLLTELLKAIPAK